MEFKANEHQHIRFNPLRNEWVLVSPHRMLRPWDGQVESNQSDPIIPETYPNNPLCPGVTRASGLITPNYTSTYVFTNDFPALLENVPEPPQSDDPLFQAASARGTCKVMCYHPRSNMYFTTMTKPEILNIINEWIKQTRELGEIYNWVQIFENKGAIMGCSNPHPHCQIWSSNFMPNEPKLKDKSQLEYFNKHGRPMLQDYVTKELDKRERVVWENEDWVVVVPYWAVWPFETMVLPKRQIQRFTDCDENQKSGLADVLKVLTCKYDNLFRCIFPYSMGWHGAPTGTSLTESQEHWTFHGCYYPPLLRSANIKKFMVGYELLAQSQRDLTAEQAADLLRKQSEQRYA